MRHPVYILPRTLVAVLVVLIFLVGHRAARASDLQRQADSVIAHLPALSGVERLDALTYICDLAYALGDSHFEQLWLEELMLEATKNEDYKLGGYAAVSLLISFYNYEMFDKLEAHYDELQNYQLRHHNIDLYYSGWNVKVSELQAKEEYYKALEELNSMQRDALERKSVFGEGIALCALGQLYYEGWRDIKQATEAYQEGLKRLAEQEYVSGTELLANYDYCSLLLYEKRLKEARRAAQTWSERIVKAIKRRKSEKDNNTTNEYYAYFYAFMTLLEVSENNAKKVRESFLQFEKYQTMSSSIIDQVFFDAYEAYYSYVGLWDSALVYNNKRLDYARSNGYLHEMLPALAAHARILYKKKEYFVATHTFEEYVTMRDSLDVAQNRLLLKEFSEAHKLNMLEASQNQFRNYLIFSLVALALISAIALQFLGYARRLRRKNSVLYTAVQQSLARRIADTPQIQTHDPVEGANVLDMRSQALFTALEHLMRERKLFRISDLTSKDLVQMLGTNRTLLAETIRRATNGKTLTEYINQYRLEYAAQLLEQKPNLSSSYLAHQAGFRSRFRFLRLFRKEFNTMPSRYGSVAKRKFECSSCRCDQNA